MQSLPTDTNREHNATSRDPTRPAASPLHVHEETPDLSKAIAVVGMGCVLPRAKNVSEFWQVLKNGVDCIREVPRDRWDPDLFYNKDGNGDKTYTKIGGFLEDFEFNSIEFRIPPKTGKALDPLQQMTLVAAREAFIDAGLLDEKLKEKRPFDRDRTCVVLGNSMGGEVQRKYTYRVSLPVIERRLCDSEAFQELEPAKQDEVLAQFRERWNADLPAITEDSMPGELSNIVSGRVANVFDLRGKNHTTDAACASSFAALDMAVKSLVQGECDLAVTGGADRSMDIDTYVKFCKIGALSPNGSTPFDARADGFVMGEGCAVFLLKRLSDAVRDGDKIHAVLRGVGASSDGRGKGITAPNKRGQVLAVTRGLENGGLPPGTVQYMEAHGTSTRVGDVVELEALAEALAPADPAPGSIAIGSVKSQVGHLKSAAGATSLLKTILAFEHQTIPPSINFETPNPNVDWQTLPFRVPTKAEPWPENENGVPRRAGISSFGFGGTNFHVVLEEYRPEYHGVATSIKVPQQQPSTPGSPPQEAARTLAQATHEAPGATAEKNAAQRTGPPALEAPSGGQKMTEQPPSPRNPANPSADAPLAPEQVKKRLARRAHLEAETLVLGAADEQGLVAKLQEAASRFPESSFLETGQGPRLKDLVYPENVNGVKAEKRVALVAGSAQDVREKAGFALSCLQDEKRMRMAPVKGVYFGEGAPRGKLAFLFPGQGSQYAEMLFDLYEKYALVQDTFHEADDILRPFLGQRLTEVVFPAYDPSDENARNAALKTAEEALKRTEICQPAVLTVDIALWRLLRSVGIEPDVVAGHSLGEYAALVAAGILRFEDALIAVSARGKEMANVDVPDHGKMASITADPQTIQGVLDQIDEYVIMANKNCPSMSVIAGSTVGVDKAVDAFQKQGIQATYIPVSAAFHSEIVAPASQPLSRLLKRLSIRTPHTPIYANVTGEPYAHHDDHGAFREYVVDVLAKQIAAPVEWTKTVENMQKEGVHYFLEVGPKRALTGFVNDILKGQRFVAAATNHPKKGGVYHFNETFGVMSAVGMIPKVKHPQATAHYTQEHLYPLGTHRPQEPPVTTPNTTPPGTASPPEASQTNTNGQHQPKPVTDPLVQAFSTNELRSLARQQGFAQYARQQAPLVAAMLRAGYEQARKEGALPAADGEPVPGSEPVFGEEQNTLRPGFEYDTDDIVIGGASVGLPGRDRDFFDDENALSILAGENRIEALTAEERGWMTDKNITRLRKSGTGSADFERIDHPEQVIKLAGVPGRLDLVHDFGVDPKFMEALDFSSELAIGAAIDALRDAGIPLVRNYQRTSTGSHLPGDWVLPKGMQEDTGVIFASAWPGYNNFVDEMSRFLAHKHAGKSRAVIENMLIGVAQIVTDDQQKQRIVDWIRQQTADLTSTGKDDLYEFNRKFVFRILAMGHAQVAQLLKAKGPNTQVNSACSSTTLAVAIAEDWIRTGRARRVLVVGADAPTKAPLFEWLSAGFLAAGAATTTKELEEAALPFDRRRHGMINGCGAVGLVVEKRADVQARGMDGLVRILATQVANSGYHASRLDVDHVADQMQRVMETAEKRYGIDRRELADDMIFMSHETYTPARGGSASAEIKSLRQTFGDMADRVLVTNTKGFTGHPHAASIEDAITVKMLQHGKVPPIPHLKEPDPELGNLNLSKGGETDRTYTLRLAAGFGSQIALWIAECLTRGTERIVDSERHQAWLRSISGQSDPQLEVVQRRLRIIDQGPPPREARATALPRDTPTPQPQPAPAPTPATAAATENHPPAARPPQPLQPLQPEQSGQPQETPHPPHQQPPQPTPGPSSSPAAASTPAGQGAAVDREATLAAVVEMIVEQTGYPADMLEPDLDLEADLGIDTVKQAELFGLLREKYDLPREEDIQIKDYPTLNHIADYLTSRLGNKTEGQSPPSTTPAPATEPTPPVTAPQPTPPAAKEPAMQPSADATPPPAPNQAPAHTPAPESGGVIGRDDALSALVELVADQTGYPADMLEPELDLEADLGIDTVKQAELFGIVGEKWNLPQEEGLQIKDYPTLSHIADYIVRRTGEPSTTAPTAPPSTPTPQHDATPEVPATTSAPAPPRTPPATQTTLPETTKDPIADTPPASRPLPGLDDLDDGAPSINPGAPKPGPRSEPPTMKQPPAGGTAATPPARTMTELNALGDGAPALATRPPSPDPKPHASQEAMEQKMASAPPVTTKPEPTPEPPETGPQSPGLQQQAPPGDPQAIEHAHDHEHVVKRITSLVADQTGYPEDMLEPDLDLEADLGIDTVKQAELFGLVRETYGLPLPEGLKISDYPTISRVADFVVETNASKKQGAGGSNGDEPPSPPSPDSSPPVTMQKTPADSATADTQASTAQESPAKQARSAPPEQTPQQSPQQTSKPASNETASSADIDRFVVVPTDAPLEQAAPRDANIKGVLLVTQDRLGWAEGFAERFAKKEITVAVIGHTQPPDSVPGYFLPTDLSDPESVQRTVTVIQERLGPIGGIVHLAALTDEPSTRDPTAFKAHAREGVRSLYLLARAAQDDLSERPGAPVLSITRMGGTFALPEADGTPNDTIIEPIHGGVSGLTKALAKELPECFVRTIDLGLEIGPQDAARISYREMTHATTRTEVGHPTLDRRVEMIVMPRETGRAQAHPIFPEDHMVVSGGAQGVTAACLRALVETVGAERAPALTLLGRTVLPENIEQLAALSDAQLGARKKALLEQLRQEQERVTPVMLEREWSRVTKAIEVHQNISRLQELGARVEYRSVDVTDAERVTHVIQETRERLGPVTAVIHGAGLEVSKQLVDKDPQQFDQVFDVKALGMMSLLWATREDPVRQVCAFSSVAGRFGNLGQVDYSAANDLAVRLALLMGQADHVRGFAMDWSAWDEVGMATKGGIMQVMKAAGVTPIPVAAGTRMFVREWLTGDMHTEIVVAGRLGQIDRDHQVLAEALPPGIPKVPVEGSESLPLIDGFMSRVPGRHAVATRRLRLDRDLYLDDHRVDSVAYLPGVFGVELFAEAAGSLLVPEEQEAEFRFISAEDIVFHTPVKLLRERDIDVRVVVERVTPLPEAKKPDPVVVADGSDSEMLGPPPQAEAPLRPVKIRCRLESDFINDAGRVLGDARVHFTGVVELGVPVAHPVTESLPVEPGDQQVEFDRAGVYDHFFHGPTFQVIERISRVEGPSVAAIARFDQDALFADMPRPRFLTAPLLREAMFQASGFWALVERSTMSLPAGIRKITHHTLPGDAPPGTSLIVVGRHERDLDDGLHAEYTVESYTPEGLLVDRMEGYRMIKTGRHEVERRDPSATPPRSAPAPAPAPVPAPAPAPGDPDAPTTRQTMTVEEDEDWELEVRDPEGKNAVGLLPLGNHEAVRVATDRLSARLEDPRFMAHWFHEEEQSRLAGMKVAKRRSEHAAGLLAAKHAVSRVLTKRGVPVDAAMVKVQPDPTTRAPRWSVPGHDAPQLEISISHSGPHAVALAVPADEGPIGVDVERVEPRADALSAVAFTPQEILWLNEVEGEVARRTTLLWTVKEAVAKGLKTGLAVDLRDLSVAPFAENGTTDVTVHGAARRHLSAGRGASRVSASTHPFAPGYIAAVARWSRDLQ